MKQDSSGYAALRGGAGLTDRTDAGRILLTGADRRAYLQGLLTNDIEALTRGTGCYAAMLNAQGRMLTDMRVLELGDSVLLDVPATMTRPILEHLDRFIFSEDVQVQDVTAARPEIGVYGPAAAAVLAAAGVAASLPDTTFASVRLQIAGAEAVVVRSDEPGVVGYDIVVDARSARTVRALLERSGAHAVSADDLEIARVESGRPRFGVDMDTDTIPLEAGIEDRAISRTKGCYVGQEVIVRVLDRGHGRVARHLAGLTFAAGAAVPAGGTAVSSGDRDIGRVTSAVSSPSLGLPIALAYLHRDFVEPGTRVRVGGADAMVTALPFVR